MPRVFRSRYPSQARAHSTRVSFTQPARRTIPRTIGALEPSNTALSSTYAGYGFNGQLQFTLPNTAVSHPVQFSVSIYGTQAGYWQQYSGGSLLTTTSATFVVGPSYLNGYQNYPYGYSSTYPTYPSTYPTYPTYPSTYPSYPAYHGFVYNPGNSYYQNPSPAYNQNTGGYYSHTADTTTITTTVAPVSTTIATTAKPRWALIDAIARTDPTLFSSRQFPNASSFQ